MDWNQVRRVYVRLPNWVGDVVLATPMFHALRRVAPQAQILAHGKGFHLKILAAEEGLFDRTLALEKRGLLWPVREGRRLRQEWGRPDVALLLPNSISAALVAQQAGAAIRVGYALNGRGPLLTHGIPVEHTGLLRPIPMVDYYLGLLRHLGADVGDIPRRPVLTVTAEASDWAERFLTRYELNGTRRIWALNLGGSWETKRWIPRYAGQLVRKLRRAGIAPILLRGPDEEELALAVCEAAGGDVPGAREVVRLGELTAVLQRCELLVTTDSGPRHFGVAAGIPVLVLIGPTHPGYTAVDHPTLRLLSERVECWPCHLKRCPVDFRCMRALTPARVQEAGNELLAGELRTRIKVSSE